MSEKITLQKLIYDIAHKTGQPEIYSEQFLKTLTAVIEEGLLEEGQVSLKGLGTFRLKWVKERTTRNVNTGETITIPGHNRVAFKPEKPLREYVNRKYGRRKPILFENGQARIKPSTKKYIAASVAAFSLSAIVAFFWFRHNV